MHVLVVPGAISQEQVFCEQWSGGAKGIEDPAYLRSHDFYQRVRDKPRLPFSFERIFYGIQFAESMESLMSCSLESPPSFHAAVRARLCCCSTNRSARPILILTKA
jgi:hypothetical protein